MENLCAMVMSSFPTLNKPAIVLKLQMGQSLETVQLWLKYSRIDMQETR